MTTVEATRASWAGDLAVTVPAGWQCEEAKGTFGHDSLVELMPTPPVWWRCQP